MRLACAVINSMLTSLPHGRNTLGNLSRHHGSIACCTSSAEGRDHPTCASRVLQSSCNGSVTGGNKACYSFPSRQAASSPPAVWQGQVQGRQLVRTRPQGTLGGGICCNAAVPRVGATPLEHAGGMHGAVIMLPPTAASAAGGGGWHTHTPVQRLAGTSTLQGQQTRSSRGSASLAANTPVMGPQVHGSRQGLPEDLSAVGWACFQGVGQRYNLPAAWQSCSTGTGAHLRVCSLGSQRQPGGCPGGPPAGGPDALLPLGVRPADTQADTLQTCTFTLRQGARQPAVPFERLARHVQTKPHSHLCSPAHSHSPTGVQPVRESG